MAVPAKTLCLHRSPCPTGPPDRLCSAGPWPLAYGVRREWHSFALDTWREAGSLCVLGTFILTAPAVCLGK